MGLSASVHDLAHWVAGRASGIRFTAYFLNGPLKIQPGLKTDYGTYLRATPVGRARMHAAGALATKAAPFVVAAIAWASGTLPAWAPWAMTAYGVVTIVTDVVWSTKKSDWKKVARERRVARSTSGTAEAPSG